MLFKPEEIALPLELARRGFRLLLVHDDDRFIELCRETLLALGLASQLMGSHRLRAEGTPSLARRFYDLLLICGPLPLPLKELERALAPGGAVVAPVDAVDWPSGREALEGLPRSFRGYRT